MTEQEEKKIKRLMVIVILLGLLIFAALGLVVYGLMQQMAKL